MPSSAHLPAIEGAEIFVTVVKGKNLVAKDGSGLLGKKKSSDPYVKIFFGGKKIGKTRTIDKTLNPEWNETYSIKLGYKKIQNVLNGSSERRMIDFVILDEDKMNNDDPMGTVSIPLTVMDTPPDIQATWYAVGKGSEEYYCKKASGELLLKITVSVKKMRTMIRGDSENYLVQPFSM